MDDIVRQAIAKWPNVPHCYGWLGLDARGQWFMRDDRTQAAGPFPRSRGSLLQHEKLVDFIHRNYDRDEAGQWFFQNGPQRVYVELEAAPYVWRLDDSASPTSHTGKPAKIVQAIIGGDDRVYLETNVGFGLVHSLDMDIAADAIESGRWKTTEMETAGMPGRFNFVLSPAARQAASKATSKR